MLRVFVFYIYNKNEAFCSKCKKLHCFLFSFSVF